MYCFTRVCRSIRTYVVKLAPLIIVKALELQTSNMTWRLVMIRRSRSSDQGHGDLQHKMRIRLIDGECLNLQTSYFAKRLVMTNR